jgi:reverse gyrase
VRNVLDIYAGEKDTEALRRLLKTMGPGGLIYAPTAEEAQKLMRELSDLRVSIATGPGPEVEAFRVGNVDYLIGVSAPYGVLVRGIDIPRRIRYAVFWGVPRFEIHVGNLESLPDGMLRAVASAMRRASPLLRSFLEGNATKEEALEEIRRLVAEGVQPRGMALRDGHIVIPDVRTYIQASGRTSRLYAGGITRGAAFVFDDGDLARALAERLRMYDAALTSIREVSLEELKKEIDRDRERLAGAMEEREVLEPLLLVIESPNKARQIARFFGRPSVRRFGDALVYEISIGGKVVIIVPTLGHLVDLVTDRGFHGVEVGRGFHPVYSYIRRCRACGHQFTEGTVCPRCSSADVYRASGQIDVLRRIAYETETVLIGTDPDSEGEKIAWDVGNLLRGYGVRIHRVEFHEVTPRAILDAINSPRGIEEKLVEAQIVRRIEDRWLGFELSRRLWERFGNRNLSAGRAQTPVLGWVIERDRESRETVEVSVVRVWGLTLNDAVDEVVVEEVKEESVQINPPPPHTTDTMLQEAFRRLGLGVTETMKLAQELFEAGLITYHRTDSTRVSDAGFNVARAYLGERFMPRRWGTGGAHECIRPTRPVDAGELYGYMKEGIVSGMDESHINLYDLIFRRFMASQCIPAEGVKQFVRLNAGTEERIVEAHGGFLDIYPEWVAIKPPLRPGMRARPEKVRRRKAAPHTQATLISAMKERGIGRPSTYAVIVGKLFQRRYVYTRKGYVLPTPLGVKVHRYLVRNYGKFVSEETTRALEERMAMVERGEVSMNDVLGEIYAEVMEIKGGEP